MATISDRPFSVVTGGSSGIGLELARQFLAHDYDVLIAADRDVEEARNRLGGNVYGLEVDLAVSAVSSSTPIWTPRSG